MPRTLDPEQYDALYASAHLESSLTVARREGFVLGFAADSLVQKNWEDWMGQRTTPFGHLLAVTRMASGEPPSLYVALSILGITARMRATAKALTVICDVYRAQRQDDLAGGAPALTCLLIVEQRGQLVIRYQAQYDDERALVKLDVPVPIRDMREPVSLFTALKDALQKRVSDLSR